MSENKPLVKVTEFTGYMGGDGECFCLVKDNKLQIYGWAHMDDDECAEAHKKLEANRLYPSDLFPDECHPLTEEKGKFKFKITIEATPILSEQNIKEANKQ